MQTLQFLAKRVVFLLAMLCCVLMSSAQIKLVLQDNREIVGEIVFENDEVVIIRDADGMRHQIATAQVLSREQVQVVEYQEETMPTKKVAALLSVNGGIVTNGKATFENLGVGLTIGTHRLLNLPIVLGGQIGYQAYFIDSKIYSFLPISLATIFPFTEKTHAPYAGINLGYGIGLQKKCKGGLFATAEVGWRYQFQTEKALFLGLHASVQQMQVPYHEEFNNASYQYETTLFLPMIGLRLSVQL